MLPDKGTRSCITEVSDKVNSSAVFAPPANGFQFCGKPPGAATSDVLTTPVSFLTTLVFVTVFCSFKLPAINILLKLLITPQVVLTGFLETTFTVITSPVLNTSSNGALLPVNLDKLISVVPLPPALELYTQ